MDFVAQASKGMVASRPRRCWVIADPEWLAFLRRRHHWPELRSIVKVVGQRSTDDGVADRFTLLHHFIGT